MSAPSKEELQTELSSLRAEAGVAYKQDSSAASSDNRPFDAGDWFFGRNLDRKYPGGPAFAPYSHRPTLLNLALGISFQDWAATAFGCGLVYALGFQHVSKIASPGLTGNRLGAALTIPVVIIGVTSGLKRAYQRHLGYLDNGEECFYPNYKKDDYTPYFMKHKVSDRHLA